MKLKDFLESKGYPVVEHKDAQFGEGGIACSHWEGMPRGEHILQIKPAFNPQSGTRTILVTNDTISSYACQTPYFHRNWKCQASRSYHSPEELEKHLDEMVNPPKGCWE